MKSPFTRFGAVAVLILALAGCGGSDSDAPFVPPPPPAGSVEAAIAAAATDPANDTSINTSAPFTVLQDAGVPAVVVKGQPVVNFTVFSDRAVVGGLNGVLPGRSAIGVTGVAIAKLIPGANGNPDEWQNYTHRTRTPATGTNPSDAVQATIDNPAYPSVTNGHTDGFTTDAAVMASRLVQNAAGYYTYTFATDITDPEQTKGSLDGSSVIFEPGLTHRVALQVAYKNAAGERVVANPYFDFTIDANGNAVSVTDPSRTRIMSDVASCNGCHEDLTVHSGGRNDVQYCVMCHNPRGVDANSGNALTMATMVHSIHAGRLLASNDVDYTVRTHDYTQVGFPQDLRNCSVCHSADNPKTPQGGNWTTLPTKEACLSCHANDAGSAWDTTHSVYASQLVGAGAAAKDLTNAQCADCHRVGSAIAPERVHWNQNEENSAKYKMNIESVTVLQVPTDAVDGKVEVKYFLSDPTNGGQRYKLESDPTRFGSLSLYVVYQNLVGQSTAVTEFTSYNNGGSSARVTAISGVNDGSDLYTNVVTIPKNTAIRVAAGTARVATIGQIKEPELEVKWATDPRPEVVPPALVNVVAQNTFQDFALTGALNPRRAIVSNDKCNVCHGALGTTSGSNTLDNAFHSGARNTVEACVVCHDANRMSSTVMTNGLALQESYQFKRMIHGIHGNSKRTYPFTHGNPVKGPFDDNGVLTADGVFLNDYTIRGFNIPGTNPPVPVTVIVAGTPVPAGSSFDDIEELINTAATNLGYTGTVTIENYAAEVGWPGVGVNCNVCHVDNSYKVDNGPIGSVVDKAGASDPMLWKVITPKAASCTGCHDSSAAIGHVTSFGGAGFGNLTQTQSWFTQETCADCHSSGGFVGVDVVHNLK